MQTIVDIQDLITKIQNLSDNEVILDVRTPLEFSQGHVAGAINIDVNNPEFTNKIQELDKEKIYIVHCRSGGRALAANQQLNLAGYQTIYSKPGSADLQEAGLELVK